MTAVLTSGCSSVYSAFIKCWFVCSGGSLRNAEITADRIPELSWSMCLRITGSPEWCPRFPKAQMWSLSCISWSELSGSYNVDLFWYLLWIISATLSHKVSLYPDLCALSASPAKTSIAVDVTSSPFSSRDTRFNKASKSCEWSGPSGK